MKNDRAKRRAGKNQISNSDLEKGKLGSLYFCLLARKCETNLTWRDLLRVFSNLGKLKFNQTNLVNIEETVLFKEEKLVDGSEVSRLETLQIDDFSQRYFTDKSFLTNGLKISVFNATNYPGLSKSVSRLIRNIGGEIVSSKDANQASEDSVLYYADQEQKKDYSFKKICEIFKIEKVLFDSQIEGDMKVVLGRDFLKRFYLK